MASTPDGIRGCNFLSQVERVRKEIQAKFERAHKLLQDREASLLAELQRLTNEYVGEGITQQINELSISMEALRNTLKGNDNKLILDQSVAPIDARIKELKTKLQTVRDTYRSVSLEWNVEVDKKLSVTGEIRLNSVREGIRDYKAIGDPVAEFGKNSEEGDLPSVFCYPNAIAITSINNFIYICDGGNNRVQVYSKSFNFVFQFYDKMNIPVGICIKHDRVYVTQNGSNCLNVYSTEGIYVSSVGKEGHDELEFNRPRGLDISTDKGRIYVAENGNDRVQCLSLNLKFNSCMGDIYGAKDVKTLPNEIVVLSRRNPCVSLYSYSHQLIREIISKGESNSVLRPGYFILDRFLNILITDHGRHCVSVFSIEGELVHRFGKEGEKRGEFIKPRGIVFNAEERILVVSDNPRHCIQIF